MYLKTIYSEPGGLFQRVEFHEGVNFIFGKKDALGDSKKSLNGIGKSTFLDLIDFCLLASFNKNHNPRLFEAKDLLADHKVVLEFENEGQTYQIKRSVDKPNIVEFGAPGNLSETTVKNLREVLGDMVFRRKQYPGVFHAKWWRPIISFYTKIQKHKKAQFLDPIKYIRESSIAELNQYHLYLLGLDNRVAVENYRILTNLKQKKPLITEIRKLLEEAYEIKSIKEAQNSINSLKREIEVLEQSTQKFVLAGQYKDAEQHANELTREIKELWFENHKDRKLIDSYQASFQLEDGLSRSEIAKVKRLYNELRVDLGIQIAKTLEQANAFRDQLRKSRKDFLEDEIGRLTRSIQERESRISTAEAERRKFFEFLNTKDAIRDLTEAFSALSEKRKVLGDLEAKLKTYDTLEYERLDLEAESKKLEIEVKKFIDLVRDTQISSLSQMFAEVYNAIYPTANDSLFTITDQFNTDAKLQIDIEFPAMMSKGRNQGRTLVYDLSVLFYAIENKLSGPRFLVHDGIFDGMDKAHLAHLYRFLETKKTTHRFQYILTLNEEGTLSDNFGPADEINPEKIAEEAILVLTPTKKLFRTDF
jgi:uncharacterized protein YydD (DUF2326 family)